MTKKRIIEVRHHDSIEQIEAEIFRYGEFVFGLHWRDDKKEIVATELSTGMCVGSCSYLRNRSPRKDLENRIKDLVDKGEMKNGVERGKEIIERRLAEIQEEEERLKNLRQKYQHPLNTKYYGTVRSRKGD